MLAYFSPSPQLPIGPSRVWAASGSVGTAARLVVSTDGNQIQTCSPLRRRLIWHEKALSALAQLPNRSQLGGDPHRAYLRNGTQLASGSFILQRETVLGKQTSAPKRLGSGSQRLPSSHLALGSP